MATLARIDQTHGERTPEQVAPDWLCCQPGVIPVRGAKTAAPARANAGALGWRLDDDELDAIVQTSRAFGA